MIICQAEKNYNRSFIILKFVPEVCVGDGLDYKKHKGQHDDLPKEEQKDQPSHVNDKEPKENTNNIGDEYVLYDDDGTNMY